MSCIDYLPQVPVCPRSSWQHPVGKSVLVGAPHFPLQCSYWLMGQPRYLWARWREGIIKNQRCHRYIPLILLISFCEWNSVIPWTLGCMQSSLVRAASRIICKACYTFFKNIFGSGVGVWSLEETAPSGSSKQPKYLLGAKRPPWFPGFHLAGEKCKLFKMSVEDPWRSAFWNLRFLLSTHLQ